MKELLSGEEVVQMLRDRLEERLIEARVAEWSEGASQKVSRQVWARIDRHALRAALRAVMDIQYPHLAGISGVDVGDSIELIYHFFIYYGMRHSELGVFFTVSLPKGDPTVDTITDLVPGALVGEREKQEMLGVRVSGIPDGRRMFLPQDFPEGVYPWRKDDKGIPDSMIKNLWRTGRSPETRAAEESTEAAKEETP